MRGRGAEQLLPFLCLWLVPLVAELIPCVVTALGCSRGQNLPFFFFFLLAPKNHDLCASSGSLAFKDSQM